MDLHFILYYPLYDHLTMCDFLLLKMTVVRSIVGAIELQPQATIDKLSPTVTSLVLEAIAQNTSGSVFEPEVMPHVSTTQRLLLLHLNHILIT